MMSRGLRRRTASTPNDSSPNVAMFQTTPVNVSATIATRCSDRCTSIDPRRPHSPRSSVFKTTIVFSLIVAIITAETTSGAVNLHLDGSPGSHARLSCWSPCTSTVTGRINGSDASSTSSLSFEFQTRRSNSLLLYVDRSASSDRDPALGSPASRRRPWFVELRLIRGGLWLRAERGVLLTVGGGLDDGRSHAVTVTRNPVSIHLTVDRSSQSASLPAASASALTSSNNTATVTSTSGTPSRIGGQPDVVDAPYYTFVGGLPTEFSTDGDWLSRLAAPSAAYEPRFVGWIRRLTYSVVGCDRSTASGRTPNGGTARTNTGNPGAASSSVRLSEGYVTDDVRLLSGSGLRSNVDESCSDYDPCQNGASCLSTDLGPVCDCSSVEYTGALCDKEKSPSTTTFYGQEHLAFELPSGAEPIVGSSETVSLYFKTSQSGGLLFFAGDGDNYLSATLRNDSIVVRVKLRLGVFETEIKPSQPRTDSMAPQSIQPPSTGVAGGLLTTRFDDERWHKLLITREARELVAHRGICYVTVQVDDDIQKTGTTVGDFTTLSSRVIYVGGMPTTTTQSPSRTTPPGSSLASVENFRGCLKQVVYRADGVSLDVISLAQRRVFFEARGAPTFGSCASDSTTPLFPVSFTSEHSVIELPTWMPTTSGLRYLRFQLVTSEPTALVMYSFGPSGTNDFFGVEMIDGFLYFVFDLGAGPLKIKGSQFRVDDGRIHQVSLAIDGVHCSVAVDGRDRRYVVSTSVSPSASGNTGSKESARSTGSYTMDHLDLTGSLYLGGLATASNAFPFSQHHERRYDAPATEPFPVEMWTPVWRRGYVGCIRDLAINSERIDIMALGRDQDVFGLVDQCRRAVVGIGGGSSAAMMTTMSWCASSPCYHNGRCHDGWYRYICDCSTTGYRGIDCRQPATTLSFNGSQFVTVIFPDDARGTEVCDITLRFRTRHPSGHLFMTLSRTTSDRLTVVLIAGRVRTEIISAFESKVLVSGQSLNDDRWHTIGIRRRAQLVEVGVDNGTKTKAEMSGSSRLFRISSMVIGSSATGNGFVAASPRNTNNDRARRGLRRSPPSPSSSHRLHRDVIGQRSLAGHEVSSTLNNASSQPAVRSFVGKMQQLIVNGREVLELVRTGTAFGNANAAGPGLGGRRGDSGDLTATFVGGSVDAPPGSIRPGTAITFRSMESYTVIRRKIHFTFSIYFKLKTTQRDGLILYIGGERDFLAVELADGQVRYIYDMGGGPRTVRVQLQHAVNDDRWHDVTVQRNDLNKHELRVDYSASTDITRDPSDLAAQSSPSSSTFQSMSSAVHFDVGNQLFIGGAPRSVFTGEAAGSRQIKSRDGFQGCLANVNLGDDIRPLFDQEAKTPDEFIDQVVLGCEGHSQHCSSDSCDNAGRCVPEWDSYTCDCDMTSFVGTTCNEDSVAYKFNVQRQSLLIVTFPINERIDSSHDKLAFGFVTNQRDAVLVHVTSGNSNDYLSVELVDGNIVAMYNMGVSDHVVRVLSKRFNDGLYHVVRLWRSGANSTLQVDDLPMAHTQPSGRQHAIFNSEAQIFVGGRKDAMGNLIRPFHGTISGLAFNGQKIFEMAADADHRVTFDGDVERDTRKRTTMKPTTSRRYDLKPTSVPPFVGQHDDKMQSNSADGASTSIRAGCQSKQNGGTDCDRSNYTDAFPIDPSNVQTSSGFGKDPDRTTRRIFGENIMDVPKPLSPTSSVTSPSTAANAVAPNSSNSSVTSGNKLTNTKPANSSLVDTPRLPPKTSPASPTPGGNAAKPSTSRSSPTPATTRSATASRSVSAPTHGSLATSVALITGSVAAIVVLLLALAFGVYKYRSRDEGVYRIDDAKNYFAPSGGGSSGGVNGGTLAGGMGSNGGYEACNSKPLVHMDDVRATGSNGQRSTKSRSKSSRSTGSSQGGSRTKRKENREWYV